MGFSVFHASKASASFFDSVLTAHEYSPLLSVAPAAFIPYRSRRACFYTNHHCFIGQEAMAALSELLETFAQTVGENRSGQLSCFRNLKNILLFFGFFVILNLSRTLGKKCESGSESPHTCMRNEILHEARANKWKTKHETSATS